MTASERRISKEIPTIHRHCPDLLIVLARLSLKATIPVMQPTPLIVMSSFILSPRELFDCLHPVKKDNKSRIE